MIISPFSCTINNMKPKEWIKNVQDFLSTTARRLGIYRFKEYYLEINFRVEKILVPVLDSEQNTLFWPVGMIRRRRYPLAVYLLAVAMYQTSDCSMREVAKLVRKTFGLEKFSHSTISRARKSLLMLLTTFSEEFNQDNQDLGYLSKKKNPTALHLRLSYMLKKICIDPLHETEKLALYFFKRYQRFLL